MNLPPLNLSASSRSGDVYTPQTYQFDGSGMSVNYGSGVVQGANQSALLKLALIAGAVWWFVKK